MPKDGTPYQPSSGTEGMWFMDIFCDRCHYEVGARQCPIIIKTMLHDPGDHEYPKEWVYQDGKPVCTKFKEPTYHRKMDYEDERQGQLFKEG